MKFNDITDLNMYKAWYSNNIHPENVKLFNKKNTIFYLRSTNKFVVLNISLSYEYMYTYKHVNKYINI